jgi:hypothetical protein
VVRHAIQVLVEKVRIDEEFWADAPPPLEPWQRDLIAACFENVDWGAIKAAEEAEDARGSGRLFDTLKLWAWKLAPSWLPHCRGRWPDSGKSGRAPWLSGPSVPA